MTDKKDGFAYRVVTKQAIMLADSPYGKTRIYNPGDIIKIAIPDHAKLLMRNKFIDYYRDNDSAYNKQEQKSRKEQKEDELEEAKKIQEAKQAQEAARMEEVKQAQEARLKKG